MKPENKTKRLSLYIDEHFDAHLRSLKEAYEEESFVPSGMSYNQFVKLLIGTGAERLTSIVRSLQEV